MGSFSLGFEPHFQALLSVRVTARSTRQLSPLATATLRGQLPSLGNMASVQLVKYSPWTCRKKMSRVAPGRGRRAAGQQLDATGELAVGAVEGTA